MRPVILFIPERLIAEDNLMDMELRKMLTVQKMTLLGPKKAIGSMANTALRGIYLTSIVQ